MEYKELEEKTTTNRDEHEGAIDMTSHTRFFTVECEEYEEFFSNFVETIQAFEKTMTEENWDLVMLNLLQAHDIIKENQMDLVQNNISSRTFLEVLEDNQFNDIIPSILQQGITPLTLQLCSFMYLMTKTFPDLDDFFTETDIFLAFCECITNFDDDENPTDIDFGPLFLCMIQFMDICAKKHDPHLDSFFSNTCDIICFLSSEFPLSDVLSFILSIVQVPTLDVRDLASIPFALVDDFQEEIVDVQSTTEFDPQIVISFAKLFSNILERNPRTVVIFQNETVGFYKHLVRRFVDFTENIEVIAELVRFLSSYIHSISLIDELSRKNLQFPNEEISDDKPEPGSEEDYHLAMKKFADTFPYDFLKSYVNNHIISFLSGEDEESIIIALRYFQALAMIHPNFLYNGFIPQTVYDFSKSILKNEPKDVKLVCFQFINTLIRQNDPFFVTYVLSSAAFFEITTDAASSMDSEIINMYIDFIFGVSNVVDRLDNEMHSKFDSYIDDNDIIEFVESIYKETEGETNEKAYQLLLRLHAQ